MSTWMIWVTVVCYAGTGIDNMLAGKWAWGVFWTCYAGANVAYIMATRG